MPALSPKNNLQVFENLRLGKLKLRCYLFAANPTLGPGFWVQALASFYLY